MGKSSSTPPDADDVHHQREQPLQAVLLCGDFDNNERTDAFSVLSAKPRILCPLHTIPLLDYALECLETNGVKEVFCVCATAVVAEELKLRRKSTKMQLELIYDSSMVTPGDALRELDKRNCVQSDPFVLVTDAALVARINLAPILARHKKTTKEDHATVLTMLFCKQPSTQTHSCYSIGCPRTDLVVGLTPQDRMIVYQDAKSESTVPLPTSFLATATPLAEMRTDLVDCGISIGSPVLLARFSDNFDYGQVQSQFVTNSVAEEEEGLQNRIYAYVLNETNEKEESLGNVSNKENRKDQCGSTTADDYAISISTPAVYATVSRDILRRWTYPAKHFANYTAQRRCIYTSKTYPPQFSSRTVRVQGPGVLIGPQCRLLPDCNVIRSVLGTQCLIGRNCTLTDTHLWDSVIIHDNVSITQSILADNVIVREGAIINKGCLIGEGCIIGSNVVLPPFTRVTTCMPNDDDEFGDDEGWADDDDRNKVEDGGKDAEEEFVSDHKLVGKDGKGRRWAPPSDEFEDDDDDEAKEEQCFSNEQLLHSECIGYDAVSLFVRRDKFQREPDDALSDDDDDGFQTGGDPAFEYDGGVTFSMDATTCTTEPVGRVKGIDVVQELKTICMEYEVSSSPIENLAIELNSFKFSQNASYADCTTAATLAIIDRLNITADMTDGKLVAAFKASLSHWSPLLQKMSISVEEEKAIIVALEQIATDESMPAGKVLSTGMSFRFLLQTLHDEEVVSEEAVLSWAAERESETASDKTLRGKLFRLQPVQDFIEWLQEDSEDDEEDDE